MRDDARDYLARVRAERPGVLQEAARTLGIRRAQVDERAAIDEARAAEALGRLALHRLLASGTLQREGSPERLRWDEANRWLHAVVARDPVPAWTRAELVDLNRVVTGQTSALREHPVYAGPSMYLEPARIEAELALLEAHVQTTKEPPVLVAAVVYVSLSTIHPFGDGNGRTARLAADRFLLADGDLPLAFASPVAAHVAQLVGDTPRDPVKALEKVLAAIEESYRIVLARLDT